MAGREIDRAARVLIAGASVRAAVQSARRDGWERIIAADLFQDRDLGPATRCRLDAGYGNLPREAARLQADAWMYCGALENHADLLERVSAPLLGCNATVLRAIRDPWQLVAALDAQGLPTIELAQSAAALPRDGTWLCKPVASAAGRRIEVLGERWSPGDEPAYFQRRVHGAPVSALFVAAGGRCRLLGTTCQLIGRLAPGDGGFGYLGSIGPQVIDAARIAMWERIGEAISRRFYPQGLLGVDAIMTDRNILPVEVNPRWTASVELLERVARWNAWSLHREACCEGWLPDRRDDRPRAMAAKRILFAEREVWVSEAFLAWAEDQNRQRPWPVLADLPAEPLRVPPGAPVLTALVGPLLVDQATEAAAELQRWFDRVRRELWRHAEAAGRPLTSSSRRPPDAGSHGRSPGSPGPN